MSASLGAQPGAWAVLRGVLFSVGVVVLLAGGRCHVRHDDDDCYCHDDDDDFDDDDFDDDDDVIIIRSDDDPLDPFRLRVYELDVDPQTGTRRFHAIQGLSLFAAYGDGQFSEDAFVAYSRELLARNAELLGPLDIEAQLSPRAPMLGADHVIILHVRDDDGPAQHGSRRGHVAFQFDAFGTLTEIEDTTRPAAGE